MQQKEIFESLVYLNSGLEETFELWKFVLAFEETTAGAQIVEIGQNAPFGRVAVQHGPPIAALGRKFRPEIDFKLIFTMEPRYRDQNLMWSSEWDSAVHYGFVPVGDLEKLLEDCDNVGGIEDDDRVIPPQHSNHVQSQGRGVVSGEAGAALVQLHLDGWQLLQNGHVPLQDLLDVQGHAGQVHEEGDVLGHGQKVGVGRAEGREHLDHGVAALVRHHVLVVEGEALEALKMEVISV